MQDQIKPPDLSLSEEGLRAAGFTDSGAPRFKDTVQEYLNILFERAILYANVDKAPNLPREITHGHIRSAAFSIAKSFGKPVKSKWAIPVEIGKCLAIAIAGVGGGHLDKQVGFIAFALALAATVILVTIQLAIVKPE